MAASNPTTWRVLTGRVEDHLPTFEPESFDACFCDPPYNLGFMGKDWDSPGRDFFKRKAVKANAWDHVGGNHNPSNSSDRARTHRRENANFQAWCEEWAREVLRCLKPGGFLLAFGGTRTFHRLTCAIEDAGFEIRDCAIWLYGQGFPKSLDISAAVDKAAGVKRETVGLGSAGRSSLHRVARVANGHRPNLTACTPEAFPITAPATEAAQTWEGYGTALKPAWEPCIVAMKPLSGTFAANALRHGVAGLNVDGCRIDSGADYEAKCASVVGLESNRNGTAYGDWTGAREDSSSPLGRWPANVILDPEAAEALDRQAGPSAVTGNRSAASRDRDVTNTSFGCSNHRSIERPGDFGSPSRFFYTSKVRPEERNLGGIDCRHPTLKPLDLCEYLARLILPPKRPNAPRRLLAPFAGAGSEMIGALEAGWEDVTGIELEEQSAEWARARIAAALSLNPAERNGKRNEAGEVLQPGLFG